MEIMGFKRNPRVLYTHTHTQHASFSSLWMFKGVFFSQVGFSTFPFFFVLFLFFKGGGVLSSRFFCNQTPTPSFLVSGPQGFGQLPP